MKKSIILVLIMCTISSYAQKKKINLKIEQINSYCGGIRPSAEMEAQLKIPVPYTCKKLICISDKNKIDTVATDTKGFLKLKLSAGTYRFFEPWKYYKQFPNGEPASNLKMDCMEIEWAKPDVEIVVTKTVTITNNLQFKPCPYRFPCLINKHLPQ